MRQLVLAVSLLLIGTTHVPADEKKAEPGRKTVEQIAESARKSLVVILFTGRDGKQQGLGSGFVVGADGLIATNLHVIGEARPITVQTADGKRHEVTSVHASDRSLDLALVRIDAKNLVPLELADSGALKAGQPIVALGHPRGLEHSVVSGVLSGRRDLDGVSMLQLAIPIEQGNSGGPVLDLQGRVHGIVTMKSLVTANLGFAVPSNALKPLLQKPNPIPMERWLTIGALDKTEWQTLLGARWRQRAGRIIAEGQGSGFGGRTLCLWQRPTPKAPCELAVTVRLDDEAGAAGLVFHADGQDRHYGFYPSGGRLRLTRFDGPDVFSWKILKEFASQHYRPGDWNTIKVRFEKDRFLCYVNDHQVLESTDDGLTGGTVGLCKFRDTVAEFKQFQVADKVPPVGVPDDVAARLGKTIAKLPLEKSIEPASLQPLLPDARASALLLRDKARLLEQQAAQLRKVAQAVHHQRSLTDLAKALRGPDQQVDLVHAALLIACMDNEELDVEAYRREVDRLAREIAAPLSKKANDKTKLEALNKFLFQDRGFHGSRVDYYTRSNSYLNEVLDDREGLPITLSVLYMELARRLGVSVVGVALPGHFVVRHEPAKGTGQLIDVYEGGKPLTEKDADKIVQKFTGEPLKQEQLTAVTKQAIILRMLHNLLRVAQEEHDRDGMLRYLDAIMTVDPDAHEERWARAVFRFQAGQREGALADVDWLLERNPPGVDLARVRELRRILTQPERK
jgi:regulator of sirC expression with transglutaminase-like and TPR domain